MTSELHDERLEIVMEYACAGSARSVLDLGCGDGELLVRLCAEPQFERIVGIDISPLSLAAARELLRTAPDGERVSVFEASFEDDDPRLHGFDTAILLETIEHIDPGRLSRVELAVFGSYRPETVIVTTPNEEYNVLYGMPRGEMRHPDHRFEWNRMKFRRWAEGVAQRNGYAVFYVDIGDYDEIRGAPTQMARFVRSNAL